MEKSQPKPIAASAQNDRNIFFGAVLSMSWQLAVVVLVPVVGGYKLDQHFKSLPLWTAVGFVLAMAGMAAVLWRMLKQVEVHTSKPEGRK